MLLTSLYCCSFGHFFFLIASETFKVGGETISIARNILKLIKSSTICLFTPPIFKREVKKRYKSIIIFIPSLQIFSLLLKNFVLKEYNKNSNSFPYIFLFTEPIVSLVYKPFSFFNGFFSSPTHIGDNAD